LFAYSLTFSLSVLEIVENMPFHFHWRYENVRILHKAVNLVENPGEANAYMGL
jgi:hypothetical protein